VGRVRPRQGRSPAVTVAKGEAVPDRRRHEELRPRRCNLQRRALRQPRRQRRREDAARAVSVAGWEARGLKQADNTRPRCRRTRRSHDWGRCPLTSAHPSRSPPRAESCKIMRRCRHRIQPVDRAAQESLGLRKIRRDHRRQREQVADQRLHRLVLQQRRATLEIITGSTTSGEISSSRRPPLPPARPRRCQHPRLRRRAAEIRHDVADLGGDEIGRRTRKPLTPTVFCEVTAVTADMHTRLGR